MFRRRKDAQPVEASAAPAEVFVGLRSQVLNLDPNSVGIQPVGSGVATWGCVMDTGYQNGVATLVCLRDGTTSLYTSSGFGIIGGGSHQSVLGENARLLAVLEEHLDQMAPSKDHAVPREGRTIIRALTFAGQRMIEAQEDDLENGRSALSPVFHAAHAVMTQLRLIHDERR